MRRCYIRYFEKLEYPHPLCFAPKQLTLLQKTFVVLVENPFIVLVVESDTIHMIPKISDL
jgi:hypothetical protein